MTLTEEINEYLDSQDEDLPTPAIALLSKAAEVLDSYRFVTSRLLQDDSYEMQMLERWVPNHHANIVGDAE